MNLNNNSIEDFYTNIDRLIKLIEVSILKKQTQNAEKYINYFFDTMISFYLKQESQSKKNDLYSLTVSPSPDETAQPIKKTEKPLEDRSITELFLTNFVISFIIC